jgi:Zn-dependent protease
MNMLLAFAAFSLPPLRPRTGSIFAVFLTYLAQINIMLASFNLIPIPPAARKSRDLLPAVCSVFSNSSASAFHRDRPVVLVLDPLIAFFRWVIVSIIRILLPG